MLDTTAAIVLVLGAVFISIIGAAANYLTKTDGNKVNVKTVSRDFLIGLALSSVAYFFVPESFNSLGKTLQDVTVSAASITTSAISDVELEIGPARF
jgi:hypothetical protein